MQHTNSLTRKKKAKIVAVPNDNSTGNTLNSYFHQIQQKIPIDFSQDATLFCTVVTSASRAIILKYVYGEKKFVIF